ncbi:Mce protein [Mycobacterium sp. SM3041]|uniref:Mce protein n=1 Tax=Mycobacterium sp. SM3041 TaxID=3114291 RepID=UPI003204E97B
MTVTTHDDRDVDNAGDIEDTVAEQDSTDVLQDTSPEPAAPQRWRRRTVRTLILTTFIGAYGLAGFLGWQLWQAHAVAEAGKAAQHKAIEYAQVLTSIDSNSVDQNFATVLNGATGEFKDMYTKSSLQLRQLLIDNKATAHGVVTDSAIQSVSRDKVVVLLMVNQTVSNTARPDPRVDRSRMKITMELVDGRWLASKVELP